ncbi:MAG: DUF58 domain-containing protein [Bacteroidota bacterium]
MPLSFTNRFYYLLAGIAIVFIFSWLLEFPIEIPRLLLSCFVLLTIADITALLLNKKKVKCQRIISDRLSNGDRNAVHIKLLSYYTFTTRIEIIEELPFQFQARNNSFNLTLTGFSKKSFTYYLRPVTRGLYEFGYTILFASTQLNLARLKITGSEPAEVKVYPSFVQMRKYELQARQAYLSEAGSKKMRKIGHSMEFEQIKEYVAGDDIRSLNWKATARRGSLMLNHFADERSQQVYAIIDKGRLMKMPFNGLSLLDYAINSSLVLCNVSLHRQDKFGLITFSHKLGTVLPAEKKPIQLNNVLQSLYRLETEFLESDFEKLYLQVRTYVRHRSLLVLFTNFESLSGMRRQLPYLLQLAKHHLLLVVFFENTELKELMDEPADNLEAVYTKTIAGKFVMEKRLIVKELMQYGILSLLTTPQLLTVQAVNKYLELKSRQAI